MASEPKATQQPKTAAQEVLSVYPVDELAENAHILKTSREIVLVAFQQAGKTQATLSEAKVIIEKFRSKEVK